MIISNEREVYEMKYFKITCSNGYCGCEETFYEETVDDIFVSDFDSLLEDYVQNYSFLEPDSRFVNRDDYETEEEYERAYDEYQEDISIEVKEITKEEYKENAY